MQIKPPSFGPKCVNHGCLLEGMGFPMPKKGTGICPVSGCPFDYEIDMDEATHTIKQDKAGNLFKEAPWKLKGEEK